jgi:two-component system sensor histidine kinase KdpD
MRLLADRLTRHGYLLAVVAVCVATLLFIPGRDVFAKGQWAILYLLVVVLVASVSGTGPAILASILAFLAWNFFLLPPYHTLRIHDDKDLLSLFAFLVAGVVMGLQTGRLRDREERAVAREREAAAVNRLSTYLVSEVSTATVVDTLLTQTVRLLGAGEARLFLPDESRGLRLAGAAPDDAPPPSDDVRAAAGWSWEHDQALGLPQTADERATGAADGDAAPRALAPGGHAAGMYVPLQGATGAQGVLCVTALSRDSKHGAALAGLLRSLANLAAAFLERQRLQEEVTSAEAQREADVLKASLLSSVSHELKTPLAALTATVSNLLETDTPWDEATTRAELEAIVADVTRLNNGVGSLLDLSRLEGGAWEPRRDWYDLDDLVESALARLPGSGLQRLRLDIPTGLPPVSVDYEQWSRLLLNLTENALLYSPPEGEVRIAAVDRGADVLLSVEDDGPGVPAEEREHVFDKFYRGAAAGGRAPSGTGLGLAIAREIVTAHGGAIRVTASSSGGARFEVTLPAETGRDAAGGRR